MGPMPTLEQLKQMVPIHQAAMGKRLEGSKAGTQPGMDTGPLGAFPQPEEAPVKPPFKMTPNDAPTE